ncbi:MAG: CD1871A family CXXC motif-containing protein [Eubacteriales bacterium]|nr:CD1871A family CXXC motif-containing protein [Eubacteriales bacterium]
MSFLKRNRIAVAVLLTAVCFVALGVWRGEAETVFRKAVNICMECIGLG